MVSLISAMKPHAVIPPVSEDRLAAVFKAYDVRGLSPEELDEPMARAIGAAFARYTKATSIAMGRDMRSSGEGLSAAFAEGVPCLLYTSPSPRDATLSRKPSSA